jgi:hypothetical protein
LYDPIVPQNRENGLKLFLGRVVGDLLKADQGLCRDVLASLDEVRTDSEKEMAVGGCPDVQ